MTLKLHIKGPFPNVVSLISPQPAALRQIQHREARLLGLNSMSVGQEPNRRIRIYPKGE